MVRKKTAKRTTKKNQKSVRAFESKEPPKQTNEAGHDIVLGDGVTKLFEAARQRLDGLERLIARECLAVADILAQAKAQYEADTGTGHGKRNFARVRSFAKAAAKAVGREKDFIYRLLAIAEIDPQSRAVIENTKAVSLRSLLALAQVTDPELRLRAATALADTGRDSMLGVIREAPPVLNDGGDPALADLLRQVADPTTLLGGIAPDVAVPADIVARFPQLASYATMGDLRRAVGPVGKAPRGRRSRAIAVAAPAGRGNTAVAEANVTKSTNGGFSTPLGSASLADLILAQWTIHREMRSRTGPAFGWDLPAQLVYLDADDVPDDVMAAVARDVAAFIKAKVPADNEDPCKIEDELARIKERHFSQACDRSEDEAPPAAGDSLDDTNFTGEDASGQPRTGKAPR